MEGDVAAIVEGRDRLLSESRDRPRASDAVALGGDLDGSGSSGQEESLGRGGPGQGREECHLPAPVHGRDDRDPLEAEAIERAAGRRWRAGQRHDSKSILGGGGDGADQQGADEPDRGAHETGV